MNIFLCVCAWVQKNYEFLRPVTLVRFCSPQVTRKPGQQDIWSLGYRDNGTSVCRDTRTQGQQGTGTTGHRDNRAQGQQDTGTTGHRDTRTQGQQDSVTMGHQDNLCVFHLPLPHCLCVSFIPTPVCTFHSSSPPGLLGLGFDAGQNTKVH